MKSNNKIYKLTKEAAPLSYMLPSRHTHRRPLLHFDGKTNRALRYARNQKSPFEDEQDGNAILEAIIFEDGFLQVPQTNPVLQEFLRLHPGNGDVFVEVDYEKDAEEEVEQLNIAVDALVAARTLDTEQLENVARVVLGRDITRMTTSEIKRDVLVAARRDPEYFMSILDDPMLNLQAKVARFFEEKLLGLRNNGKDVYYNLPGNKKKMLTVPNGEDKNFIVASFLQSDEGIEALKLLENNL